MVDREFRDPAGIVIYGLDACEDTTHARGHLGALGVDFRYVRLDHDVAIRDRLHAAGHLATPVVVTPDGALYVEPSDTELDAIVAATA